MRLYVEAALGFGETRKRWMGCEQRVSVGRSEWADLTIWEDRTMADVHFELLGDRRDFFIRDLTGNKSITVNGECVAVSRIRNHDLVYVGTTRFRLNVKDTHAVQPGIRGIDEVVCPSGVVKTRCADMQPATALQWMPDNGFHFVIDSSIAHMAAGYGLKQPLVDRRSSTGPILVSPDRRDLAARLCDALGDHEYLVIVNEESPVEILARIRKLIGTSVTPSVLTKQLQHSPPEFAQLLLDDFGAILIAEESNTCQIFAAQGFKHSLEESGGRRN